MTKARYKRPSTPAEIAALVEHRRQQREDAEYFEARAIADPSVIVRTDHRGAVVHARRGGVFGLMLSRKTITEPQHSAVNRLYDDLAIARGEADQGLPGVAGTSPYGPVDRALAAQDRVRRVSLLMTLRLWIVLRDLIVNEIGGAPTPWRDIVRMATGEEDPDCQAMALRWACAELVSAYATLDEGPPAPERRAKLYGGV